MAALGVLIAATLLRVWLWSRAARWSPSDETVMARLGLQAAAPGYSYRRACHDWLKREDAYHWPGMVRFGNVLLVGAAFRLFRANTYSVPAAVSTAAGIATLWLSWALALWAGCPPTATTALILAFSPLQLHLGRRALQDQLVCATTLAALYSGLAGHPLIGLVFMAAMVAVKETTVPHVACVAIAWAWAGMPWMYAAGCTVGAAALYIAAFTALTGEPLLLWKLGKQLWGATASTYGVEHQEGEWHRLLVDLLMVSPVAFLLAVHGWTSVSAVCAFFWFVLFFQNFFPVMRCVRMVLSAEAVLRVIAATSPVGLVYAACVAVTDLTLFRQVFQRGEVYDPVHENLAVALGFCPDNRK